MNAKRLKTLFVILMPVIIGLLIESPVLAQGSIFGTVQNSDQTIPANGEITFFGFIGGTDDEIRTESSIGAGYDSGNWFDDFQNYLDEAAGQPYQYRFFNMANGEGVVLDGLIPNNSFQQQDVQLAFVNWPTAVANPYALVLAENKILLGWDSLPDHSFHIYRRYGLSGGSFYRIDNLSGNLADPGVTGNYYIDIDVDGSSTYDYLIIAESAGVFGAHSEIISLNSTMIAAPVLSAIAPAEGSIAGRTAVTISGSRFDIDGVTVTIGSDLLTDVVISSSREITGLTPPGPEGLTDVFVTNVESGLNSNVLSGGFNYIDDQNAPPVLYGVSPKNGLPDRLLRFTVYSVDADGDAVLISGQRLPSEATLSYNGYNPESGFYEATFEWTPGVIHVGVHDSLEILAYDLLDTTTAIMSVRIFDNGYVCGDADGNWVYNILDIIYLISYKYNDPPGPVPVPPEAGDANGDGIINLKDILYLIAFLYDNPPGPAPVCP